MATSSGKVMYSFMLMVEMQINIATFNLIKISVEYVDGIISFCKSRLVISAIVLQQEVEWCFTRSCASVVHSKRLSH